MTYGHGHVFRYLNVTCLTQVAKGSLQLFRNSKCQEQLKLTVATLEECFPGASGSKESPCIAGDMGSIPGRRKGQPTPIFLPGESHGQKSLVGYSPWGCRVRYYWVTNSFTFTFSTPEEKNALEVLAPAITISAWKKHIHGLELVSGPHRPQETRQCNSYMCWRRVQRTSYHWQTALMTSMRLGLNPLWERGFQKATCTLIRICLDLGSTVNRDQCQALLSLT